MKGVDRGNVAIGKDKLVAIPTGAFFLFSADEIKKGYKPLFMNVCECIALVIDMKDGSKVCYHRFRTDGVKSFERALKEIDIKGEDIESVRMFGGALNTAVLPTEGDAICVHSYLGVKNSKEFSLDSDSIQISTPYAFLHGRQEDQFYSGNYFILHQNLCDSACENVLDFALFEEIQEIGVKGVMSPMEDMEYENKINSIITSKKLFGLCVGNFLDPDANQKTSTIAFFRVKSIRNFVGHVNKEKVLFTLKKAFPNVDIESKATHQYTPLNNHLVVDGENVTFFDESIKNLATRDDVLAYKIYIEGESPYNSETEDELYNAGSEVDRLTVAVVKDLEHGQGLSQEKGVGRLGVYLPEGIDVPYKLNPLKLKKLDYNKRFLGRMPKHEGGISKVLSRIGSKLGSEKEKKVLSKSRSL